MAEKKKRILLSAGGTGGHLFPAQALAEELRARGLEVHLATDMRANLFAADFPAESVTIIPSATFGDASLMGKAKTMLQLAKGYSASHRLLFKLKPKVVVGFGGYPTVPPLLAAVHRRFPTILHEQNAVIGRANRFLAGKVDQVASGFELGSTEGLGGTRHEVTGNPLRALAHEAAREPYLEPGAGDVFRLLVFGGSQGAQFFSRILPEALALLPPDLVFRLRLVMQARPEDAPEVRMKFEELQVDHVVSDFFGDMPQRIAQAQFVICRAGASSVSELALIGRPSLLVPLPGSLDDDQGANAAELERQGGAVLVRQKELDAERLATILQEMIENPGRLGQMAASAKQAGIADASARLADLVEQHA